MKISLPSPWCRMNIPESWGLLTHTDVNEIPVNCEVRVGTERQGKKPRGPRYMWAELPTSISQNVKKKLEAICWLVDGLAMPDPRIQRSSRQHLKLVLPKATWLGGKKMDPLPFHLGDHRNARSTFISATGDSFHVRHIRLYWEAHLWFGVRIMDQRQWSLCSPVSGFRGSICPVYPRHHQCCRTNSEVWNENHFAFGKEPFSNQAATLES